MWSATLKQRPAPPPPGVSLSLFSLSSNIWFFCYDSSFVFVRLKYGDCGVVGCGSNETWEMKIALKTLCELHLSLSLSLTHSPMEANTWSFSLWHTLLSLSLSFGIVEKAFIVFYSQLTPVPICSLSVSCLDHKLSLPQPRYGGFVNYQESLISDLGRLLNSHH